MTKFTFGRRGAGRMAIVAIATSLSLAACGGGSGSSSGDTIVVGDLESLTGASASVGVPQANAVKLAVKQINAGGGIDVKGKAYKIELDIKDDKSDPSGGVAAVQGFVSGGTKFMVGTLSSAVLGAYLPTIQDNKEFISVVVGAALNGVTKFPSIYRPRVTLPQYTQAITNYLAKVGDVKTIATLTDSQHSGFVEQLKPLKAALKAEGIEVVADESYALGATDFSAQVSSMLRANPDAINMRGFPADVTRAIKQARAQGYDGPIYATSGITLAEVNDAQAAKEMDGVIDIFAALPNDLIEGGRNEEAATKFLKGYQKEYGEEPGGTSMSAYDGVYLLAAALEKAGTVDDVAAVRKALDSLKVIDVPQLVELINPQAGDLVFKDRQSYFTLAVRVWRDGKFHADGFVG